MIEVAEKSINNSNIKSYITSKRLEGFDFIDCNITANISNLDISYCTFTNCNFTTELRNSTLTKVKFDRCKFKLYRSQYIVKDIMCNEVVFKDISIPDGGILHSLKTNNCNMDNCYLQAVSVSNRLSKNDTFRNVTHYLGGVWTAFYVEPTIMGSEYKGEPIHDVYFIDPDGLFFLRSCMGEYHICNATYKL